MDGSSFWLSESQALACIVEGGGSTPLYVYSESALESSARSMLEFPAAFGLTVRYAMKACPTAEVLRLFLSLGLSFDASSGFEVYRAVAAGVPAKKISLSTQELPINDAELTRRINSGVQINACSLRQIERLGRLSTNGSIISREIGLRFNPGVGSGSTAFKTNVGGPHSSFGIWHESASEAASLAKSFGLRIVRLHTHIGSGSDPAIWERAAELTLAIVRQFPEVHTVNLGGGYKVSRVMGEKPSVPSTIGAPVRAAFEAFANEPVSGGGGRKLMLEVEPGTYLVANAGCILTTVTDIVKTPLHSFIKLDTGMTEILRPTLYGSQHPLHLLSKGQQSEKDRLPFQRYVVVGHCCESGDLITCAPGEPEKLLEREMPRIEPGDLFAIGGAGAYCSSMSSKNYNSFPEAAEVLLMNDGSTKLIRRRQSLEQIFQNEV
jgi:diaminopimelate decarboxylase